MIKEYGNKLQTHNVIPFCDLVAEAGMKYGNLFNISWVWGLSHLQRVAPAPFVQCVGLRALEGAVRGKLRVRSRVREVFNLP